MVKVQGWKRREEWRGERVMLCFFIDRFVLLVNDDVDAFHYLIKVYMVDEGML